MPFEMHTVEVPDGSTGQQYSDRVVIGTQLGVANLVGGGAGSAVTTAVTFPGPLPPNYQVHVTLSQDATCYVTSKTSTGFNVVMLPRLAANTLAAGTFDVTVIA